MIVAGYPRGLLSLLQAQNFGQNPNQVADFVQTIIDATDLYGISQQNVVAGTINPMTAGFNGVPNGIGPVPAGEVWKILRITGVVVTGVGVTVAAFSPALRQDGAVVQLGPAIALAASQTRWTSDQGPGYYIPSGAELGTYADGVVGAPIGAVTALIQRLKA